MRENDIEAGKSEITKTLQGLDLENPDTRWRGYITEPHYLDLKIYLRVTKHFLESEGAFDKTIDLANLEVHKTYDPASGEERRRPLWEWFNNELFPLFEQGELGGRSIYVEQVLAESHRMREFVTTWEGPGGERFQIVKIDIVGNECWVLFDKDSVVEQIY